MKANRSQQNIALYIVFPVLFALSVLFNDTIAVFQSHPDILLIFIIYLVYNLKPGWVICCAFLFGFLQDVFLPGNIQYWGLAPLLKVLLAYAGIRFSFIWGDRRSPLFYIGLSVMVALYFILYNMMYYSGYADVGGILLRYTLPEYVYTLTLMFLINMILPINNKN